MFLIDDLKLLLFAQVQCLLHVKCKANAKIQRFYCLISTNLHINGTNIQILNLKDKKTASNRFIACSFVVYKYYILSSSNTLMSFLSIILRLPTASINGT